MIRKIGETVVAFDCEWIPDVNAARALYPEALHASDEQLRQLLWARNGATDENPRPFVRLMQSQLVSIAMMVRKKPTAEGLDPELSLVWLPKKPDDPAHRDERRIITSFITAMRKQPQLVGFNSKNSDIRILMQRALALGIPAPSLLSRPEKPWEGVDYFARESDYSIDLMELISGFGARGSIINLDEACVLSGIPGKFDAHGDQVLDLWLAGKYKEIVRYNAFDAISTYLLWLRLAWISGAFTDAQYENEVSLTHDYLMGLCDNPETAFIEEYIHEWDRLTTLRETYLH